jgi:transcriptional regulator with XRE-family HTH domain
LVHVDTLGSRLHAVRNQAELTQTELARLAGLKSTRHIGLIEEDERANPTLETSKGICRVTGMSLDWFLLGKGDAPTLDEINAAVSAARASVEGDSAPAAE